MEPIRDIHVRNVFATAKETKPADTYDALAGVVGKGGQRVIRGLHFIGEHQFFGRAVTVRSLPARPDYIKAVQEETKKEHGIADPLSHAISLCNEESVLVVDASGYNHTAVAGGTKMAALAARKAAGLVTDGALRDQDEFQRYAEEYGMNTSCAGWTAQSGTGSVLYPSDINIPISVHGVLVRPGDYIMGDRSAVLVIPEETAEEILELGVVHTRMNDFIAAMLEKTKGTLGREVQPRNPESIKIFLQQADLSARQTALFRKYMGGEVA